ncbi:(2Fe-2S)-binding protein [Maricurvus nonylphenolicus]|uniref:(2Fe-2S)-binding protein n=1 Tax=Maricurvus nonylphenolicus TaxID=1008307 RepID=UPI0036F2FDCB
MNDLAFEVKLQQDVAQQEPVTLDLTINGTLTRVVVEPHLTLTSLLRNTLNLTGTKETCAEGACGSCTVLVDGIPTLACVTMAATLNGKTIETIEGLANGNQLHPIQEAFLEERGSQCGYCSPGFVMTTKHLLATNASPSVDEIKQALSGNICRCGAYEHIINSVQSAATKLAKEVK